MTSELRVDELKNTSGISSFTIDSDGSMKLTSNKIKNSSGVTSFTLESDGVINYTQPLQQNGSTIIQWIELTPASVEWSWSGGVNSSAKTLSPTSIPSTARYLLADVFVTADTSDHQNIVLGRTSSDATAAQNWVNTRGQQPSTIFSSAIASRQAITLTYNGEADNYSPNYGMWYSSQVVPCAGRTVYFSNYGNSGSNGWVYVRVRAYSY